MVNCTVANTEINQRDLHRRKKTGYKSRIYKLPISSNRECGAKNVFLWAFRYFSFQVKTSIKVTWSLRIYHWAFSPTILWIFNELSENSLCTESHWLGMPKDPLISRHNLFARFGGILLMETTKNSFDHSTKTLISDQCWFGAIGGWCSAESFLPWNSWAQAGVPEHRGHWRVWEPGLAFNCQPGSISILPDSLWSSSVPEKFPNKAEWICQALLYVHTTRTLAGLFLRMGHHLGELRKQLIRAPGENPFLPGHCCAME